MPTVNLNRESYLVDDGLESKVIIRDLADVPGGRALDVTDVTAEVIKAGHVIIMNTTNKVCKPLGVSGEAYESLPEGYSYLGVLKCSVLTSKPAAAILTVGEVNAACSPYPVTTAIMAALPQIKFI